MNSPHLNKLGNCIWSLSQRWNGWNAVGRTTLDDLESDLESALKALRQYRKVLDRE